MSMDRHYRLQGWISPAHAGCSFFTGACIHTIMYRDNALCLQLVAAQGVLYGHYPIGYDLSVATPDFQPQEFICTCKQRNAKAYQSGFIRYPLIAPQANR